MAELEAQVLCAIAFHQMLKNGDTVIVACSGGADSVTLLHFLFSHAQTLGITLRAAHVNHGLRGCAADADEAFVAALCERLAIPLAVLHLKPDGEKSEDWGRRQRYAFFDATAEQCGGAKIATAHTQNDNAETVLLHLARGAGLHGACGIPPVRGNIIRPLLTLTRAQIEQYVAQNGLAFCSDATNAAPDYARNRVRNAALPALESVNLQACAALARFAQHTAQAVDFLREHADALLRQAEHVNPAGELCYRAKTLAHAHPAVRAEVLHRLLAPHADVTQTRLALADEAVRKGSGAVQLSEHAVFSAAQGLVRINTPTKSEKTGQAQWEQPFPREKFPQILGLPDASLLNLNLYSYEKTVNFQKQGENPLKFVADYGKINGNATFRTGRTGDTFAPAGGNGTKTLKKLYSEAKLSEAARRMNPVLAIGSRVLWAAGFGFARGLAPDAKTQQCLTIETNRGILPHNNVGGNRNENIHG